MEKLEIAEKGIFDALSALGQKWNDSTKGTPRRIAKYWNDLLSKEDDLRMSFFDTDSDEMVIVKDIGFISACEHHMLPFFGKVQFGYIPNKKIIGLSKIPRLIKQVSFYPQTQEYLSSELRYMFEKILDTKNIAIKMEAVHTCLSCRGIKETESTTITSAMGGLFREEPQLRAEFLSLIK